MFGKIKEKLLKSSYVRVYGDRAKVVFKDDIVEILVGNKKITHDAKTGKKLEETIFSSDKMIVIKFDENEKKIGEEVFVDDKKVCEVTLSDGKSTVVENSSNNINKVSSKYERDGEFVVETTLKSKDREDNAIEIIEVEGDEYVLKSILKKTPDGGILVDAQIKYDKNGNLLLYKENGLTIELDYFDGNKIDRFELSKEVPVYEEEVVNVKGKGKSKANAKPVERKIIGSEIKTELVRFDEEGRIVNVERGNENIVKEYYDDGSLYRQYMIIESDNGMELVGKIINIEGDEKTINNSTLSNEDIIKKNEEMFNIDFDYKVFELDAVDYEIINDELRINRLLFNIGNEFIVSGRKYESLENGVLYYIIEKFDDNGTVTYLEKTNKVSGTKLIYEGEVKYVIGMDGVKKEVTEAEYQIYKIADELNKIDE